MKEEVKFELGDSSSLGGGIETRDETQASSSCIEVSENIDNSKRLFKGSVLNGLIVYTRVRKSGLNCSNDFSDNDRNKRHKGSDEPRNNVIPLVYARRKDKAVQIVVGEEPNCNLGIPVCKEVQESELERSLPMERGAETCIAVVAESSERKSDLPKKEVRRYSRLVLRPKVEPPPESVVNAPESAQNGASLNLDGEAAGGVSGSKTKKNKLEWKMSKKIALNKKPMTVKELFETGFLDGVTVVYMGCNKVILMLNLYVIFFIFVVSIEYNVKCRAYG